MKGSSTRARSRFRVVGVEALREAVDGRIALQAVEGAFRALAEGRAAMPLPLSLEIPEVHGEVHAKAAHLGGSEVFALKVASGFFGNEELGLPTGSGLVLLFDSRTGFPVALFRDEGWLTEMRTGAAGALAVRLLGPERVENLAVVGTGSQARFQLRAIAAVRAPSRVRAWSPHPTHVLRYCREMEEELGLEVVAAASPADAVRDADVVVTVTPSRAPVVPSRAVADHATVVAVGADGAGKQELEADLLVRAHKVVVDHLEQCAGLGELQHPLRLGTMSREDVHGTLGDVLTGQRPGRERADELVVCDLTGVGVQDAAIAAAAWEVLSRYEEGEGSTGSP